MLHSKLFRFFPIPQYLILPSFGLEISEKYIRYVELIDTPRGFIVNNYGVEELPIGLISKGVITNLVTLSDILKKIRIEKKIEAVSLSISEEQVYTFQTDIKVVQGINIRDSILLGLEGHIPIPSENLEFDYSIISQNQNNLRIQVTAVERQSVQAYVDVCALAGIQVIACEYESQALARALTKIEDKKVIYVINIDELSTTASVVQDGIVVSSSTVPYGGNNAVTAIMKSFNLDKEKAQEVKNKIGINADDKYPDLANILKDSYTPLVTEIINQYNSWLVYIHERSDTYRNIDSIQVVGSESLTPGIIDLLQATFHKPVSLGDVWCRIRNDDPHVPSISFNDSLNYGTAIGLALGSFEI